MSKLDTITDGLYERNRAHHDANPGWQGSVLEIPGITPRERAPAAVATAYGQIYNGGLHQYVDNNVAHRAPQGGVISCIAAGAVIASARDRDPEVADRFLKLLAGASAAKNRDDFATLNLVTDANGLMAVTDEMFDLGHERIETFLYEAVMTYPEGVDPFATEWRPEALPGMRRGDVRYPNVVVDLTGVSANAFSIVGVAAGAMRRARVPAEEIEAFRTEATSGTYDKVLSTLTQWVNVSIGKEDEFDNEDDPDADDADEAGPRM